MKPDRFPWLHIIGQFAHHSEAAIIGTNEGLIELRNGLNKAIVDGNGEAKVISRDGEGYSIVITRSTVSLMGEPRYLMYDYVRMLESEDKFLRVVERAWRANEKKG